MQRISALSTATASTASQTMLNAVQKKIGMVPNLFKTIAHSPAALQAYLQHGEALAGGVLPATLREQIALATAGANHCDYCASAHTLIGKGAGISAAEAADNLHGKADNAKTQAALDFARAVVGQRGQVTDAQVQAVRAAGYNDEEIVEIISHVALNIFTNYFNHIAATVIDFPLVTTAEAKAA